MYNRTLMLYVVGIKWNMIGHCGYMLYKWALKDQQLFTTTANKIQGKNMNLPPMPNLIDYRDWNLIYKYNMTNMIYSHFCFYSCYNFLNFKV